MAEKLKYLRDGQDEIRIEVNQDQQDGITPVRVEGPGSDIIRRAPQGSVMDRIRQGILQRRAAQSKPASTPEAPTEPTIPADQSRSFAPFEDSAPITDLKFDKALANTLGIEGAGVDYNEVRDSGISQYGVTQKAWDAYSDKKKMPRRPVNKLTDKERKTFYREEYAKPLNLENLPDEVAMVAFDYGVNAGPGTAAMALQKVLGVKADGVIGPKTIAAIKSQNPRALAEKLLAMQESHYARLVKEDPTEYAKYKNGWQDRINAQRQKLALGDFGQKLREAQAFEKAHPEIKLPEDPDLKVAMHPWLSTFLSGATHMAASISRIPAFAVNNHLLLINIARNAEGKESWATPDWLINNPVSKYLDRAAELLDKQDERFGYTTEIDDKGIRITRPKNFEDIVKEGDKSEMASYIGWSFMKNSPQILMQTGFLALRAATLGSTVLAALAGADKTKINALKKDLDIIKSQANILSAAVIEGAAEKLGTFGMGPAMAKMLVEELGETVAKSVFLQAAKTIVKGSVALPAGEGIEELVTELANAISDYALGVDKNAFKGIGYRMAESFMVGALSGGSMTAPIATLSAGAQVIGQRREQKYKQAVERLKKMYGGTGEGTSVNVPGPDRMVTPRRLKEMAQKRLNDLETAAKGSPAVLGRTIPDPDRPGQSIEIPDVPAKEGRILTQAEREERAFLKQALSEDNIQSIADEYGYGLKTPTQSGVDTQAPSEQVIEGELYQAQKQAEENPVPQGNGLFKIDDPVMSEETLESTKNLAKTLKTGDIYESATGEEKFVIKVDKHGAIYFANEEGTWVRSILDASIGSDADGVRHTTFRWSNNGLSDLARGRIIRPSGESARYKVAEEDDTAETLIFVSPSIETSDAADMVNRENVTTLYKKTKGGKHASFKSAIRGVMIDLGVPADVSSALGIWEDGGEDTVIARLPEGTDIDTIKYLGAQAAKLYPQKAYLWFKPKKSGKNHMTKMTLPLKYDEAVGILLRNGIKFATVVPTKDGTEVYQFHESASQLEYTKSVAKDMGGTLERTTGDGGFVGGETRAAAVAQYNKDIKESRARIIAKSLKEAKDVLRRKRKSLAETNARRAGKENQGAPRVDSRSKRPQGVLIGAEESLDQAGKLKVFQVAKAIAKALDVRYIGRDATPDQKKQRYKEGLRRFYDLARQSGRDVKEREFYAVAANKAIAQLIDTTFPELADPDKQGIFKVLLAITSNGNLVSLNTKYAMDQMRHYLDTGDFNTKTVYARNEISAHLKKLQELIDQYGEVEAIKHLTEYQKQLTPTGKQSAEPDAPRAVDYFGDKIGRYFTNVFGLGREVTIDLWQTRLYHILMGDIKSFYEVSVKRNKKGDFETGNVFPKVVESPGKVEKRVMREAITELANELGETPADLQSISWHEIKQLYAKFSGTEVEIMDYNDAVTDLLEDSGETDVQEGDRKFSRPGTDELGNELGYDEEMLRNKKGREFIAKWLPEYAHLLQQPASLTTDSGMRILGDYLRGVIRVLSGQPLSVYKHEGFHAFFDLFVSPQDKIRLLDAIQREYPDRVKAYADKYGVSQDRAAEEVMAEIMETIDNKRFVYEGKSIPEQIVTFLQQVIEKMKVFFGIDKAIIQDMADAFYEMRRSPSQARQVEERNLYAGQRAEGFEDVPEGDRFWAPDKKLRFEIPDKDAELTFKAEVETLASEAERIKKDETIHWASRNQVFEPVKKKLEDAIKSKRTLAAMLNHPELYKRYPWAKNIPIIVKKLPRGTMGQAYNSQSILSPEGSHIRISSSFLDNMTMLYSNTQMESYENFRNTLLHEVQHMIQAYENFAQGGSVSKYGFLNYVRLLGEVESRDVEARSRMTEEQRRALKAYESQVDPVEAATRDNWKRKIRSLDDVVVRQTGAVDFDIPRVYEAGSLRAQQIRTYFAKPAPDRMPAKPTSVYVIRIADESNADKDFSTFPSVAAVYEPFESRSAALAVLKNLETTIPEKKKQYLRDYGYGEAKPENVKAYVVQETHRTEGDRSEYNRVVDRKIVATEEDAQNFDETKILEELQRRMVGEKKKAIKSESSEPMYKIDERDSDILKDIDQKLKFGGYTQDQIKAEYAERGIDIQFKGEAIRVSPSKVKGMVREVTGQVKDEEARELARILQAQEKGAKLGYKEGVKDATERIRSAKEILDRRRARISGIRDMYGLSDADLRRINKKDIRLMNNYEFKTFIDKIDAMAASLTTTRDLKNQVLFTIQELELKKVDNLIQAMELPSIEDMSPEQLDALNDVLMEFQKGDEFLSVRKLQTVKNTELSGIRTVREAKEHLAKKMGVSLEKVNNIKVGQLDAFRYDTQLARKNPFYQLLVDETNASLLEAEQKYLEIDREVDDLVNKARISRKGLAGTVLDMAPTDTRVFAWLEAPADQKQSLAKDMTPEEIALASYLQARFAQFRDYLIQQETLKNYRENYITHIRRGFLEAMKADGILTAFKEVFTQAKEDEAMFNILQANTQNILPLEKFFQFAMRRSGEMKPSENVSKAFKAYTKAMLKKQALDKIVPSLVIYSEILSPTALTPRGLEMDQRLKNFVKEWLNNKKGRRFDYGGKVPQGGAIDIGVRSINAFVTLLDLGLNIPVGISANVGEQFATYVNLGEKRYAKGLLRMQTPRGRKIIAQNRAFIGKTIWSELSDTSASLGDKFNKAIFGLFHLSTVNANKIHLLGSLTDEEWRLARVSPARLAQMRRDMGRLRAIEGAKSVIGATSAASIFTKYKSWAIPILTTAINDISTMTGMLRKGDVKKTFESREFQEILRATIITGLAVLAAAALFADDDDDETFLGEVTRKAVRESQTFLAALNPTTYTSYRMLSFLADLARGLTTIRDRYKDPKRKNEYKGLNLLKRTLTPRVVKSMFPEQNKKKGLRYA